MIAWRLTKRRYSTKHDVLAGEGAREGGCWNRAGLPLVYASENASLAILETLVHVTPRYLPSSLVAVRITLPDDVSVAAIPMSRLPRTWREVENRECVAIGSTWVESRSSLVLRVPSAANSLEENLLINPLHPDIECCGVDAPVPVVFDARIVALVT